ncbi:MULTISPECIES: DUF4249 domain-containing protein [unclassified Imperialibacter]|uniref:DUF4249 domain-containing protein n=1 Tax=unclassified Imperialibacter TaxID=2629706 RepID=UPI00125B6D60|nr:MULTISPECIES: DUF4249 domain-containing protein [unclassified Imperialibacter]CAD5290720.1 conserved hypothetical protein [Imperialibacter sp. 89]CAD5290981.1 conserved hypothetical protein [Imperialibacter sp. 75]VVT34434.1 conserved hypothetical protein [Imperialibacter sp. EC-SDR9]
MKNLNPRPFKNWLLTSGRNTLILLLLGSCIEQFDPKVIAYQSVLVVDGYLSDKAEPYRITLSRSRALNNEEFLPELGASVSIIGSEGETYHLVEGDSGRYVSNPTEFVALTGQAYTLDIITGNGNHYQSDPVTVKVTPPIDSVYFRRERRIDDDGFEMDGIKILVDAHDATGGTRYYRYEWKETYEISLAYAAPWDYDSMAPDPRFPIKPIAVFAGNCYNSRRGNSILTVSTNQLSEDKVSEFEINYVSTADYKLRKRYSILVEQFALDEDAFHYWSELQKNSENLGTLFDPLPYELRGNVRNLDDPDEVIVGYFDAAQSSQMRLFVDGIQLRDLSFPSTGCPNSLDTVALQDIPLNLQRNYLISVLGPYPVEYVLMAPRRCADCRVYGSLEKPDFW